MSSLVKRPRLLMWGLVLAAGAAAYVAAYDNGKLPVNSHAWEASYVPPKSREDCKHRQDSDSQAPGAASEAARDAVLCQALMDSK
jgi:hypothetical protein